MNRQISFLLVCLLHFTMGFASTFNMSVEVTPTGAGSLNVSSGTYEEGSSVYLRTYANTGYVFKGWYESDTLVSSAKSFYYTMPSGDVRMQARYEYDPAVPADPNMPDTTTYYSFSAAISPIGAGSVNVSSGKYAGGKTVSLRAYTNTGYKFNGWMNGAGELLSSSTSYSYTMPYADAQLTALYTYDPTVPADPDSMTMRYTLTLTCKPMGGGSFNTSGSKYAEGDNVHLYAYTNTGYKFVRWEDEGGNVLSSAQSFYYVMPHGNTNIYGIFEYDPSVPANPGANHWNAETGEVIMDDYSIGYLRSAIDTRIGGSSNRSKVSQITVSGKMNGNDFGLCDNFTNCTYIDLSRTGGYTEISSYAFDNSSALAEIILPSCVERIGYRAFYNSANLTSVTCYANTPPTVDSYVFSGISDGAVLYVPATAISAYQEADGWKDAFSAILPITSDVCAVEVNLPAECADGRYKDMTLELINTVTGQKHTYVINDRTKYVFNGLVKKSSFNAYLRNQQGVLLGEIDDIQLQEEDVAVTFTDLLTLYTVHVKVAIPDGTDVTKQMQAIQWIDASGNYLSRADSIIGQVAGTPLQCQLTLPQELGMKYKVPETLTLNVSADTLTHKVTLAALSKVTVKGTVKSDDGSTLADATISVSQKLNGLYTQSSIAKTDNSGAFSMELYNEPTSITVAATDYISKTVEYADFTATTDLGQFALKSITGAVITTNLTYTESVADGETAETQNWYSDYANVAYNIYNKTTGKAITQFNVQYPQIVLLEEVTEGDQLKITATSKKSAFEPVEAEAVIDSTNRATATFPIVELGAIKASFTSTDNASVVGLLYDGKGQFMKKYSYSEAQLNISSLDDGDYTLVTMTNSTLFNSILNLSQYAAAGLTEGTDYVKNAVTVKSGVVAMVNNDVVPVLDESKLYYTGEATSFTVNKTSITSGNYLTLRGKIDFKDAYASSVSGVKMVVDLPESCSFVENSVMVGSSVSSYTLNGNRVTIPIDNNDDQVRFCVIPTEGGSYAPSAFASFTLAGKEIMQPIGNANYEVKDLSISVPSTVAKTSVAVTGTAPGKSAIKIYDGETLIGETTALANGAWSATCELNEPYNLSTHSIYAKVTTTQGMELQSETEKCMYDKNAIQVSKVIMYHENPEMGKTYEVVFDFLNPTTEPQKYTYYIYNKQFTFIIDFTNNDTTIVSDVTLKVKTGKGNIIPLEASYDKRKGLWVACAEFGNMYDGDIPVNVSVAYRLSSEVAGDRERFDLLSTKIDNAKAEAQDILSQAEEYKAEALQIEKDAEERAEKMATLLDKAESTSEGEDMDKLIEEILTLSTSYTGQVDLSINIPDELTDKYKDSLKTKIEALLNDNSLIVEVEDSDLIERYESVMSENLRLDYEESIKSMLQDRLVLTKENGDSMVIHKIDLSEINSLGWSLEDTTSYALTDGSRIVVYVDDNDNALIIDSLNQYAWVIENCASISQAKIRIAKAKRENGDFVAKLKQVQDDLHYLIKTITDTFGEWISEAAENVDNMKKVLEGLESERTLTLAKSASIGKQIEDIEKSIKELDGRPNAFLEETEEYKAALKVKRCALWNELESQDKKISDLAKKTKSLQSKLFVAGKVYGELKEAYDLVMGIKKVFTYIGGAINDHSKWHRFIDKILPCEDDYVKAVSIKKTSEDNWTELAWKTGYYPALAITGIATGINGYMMANKAAKFIAKLVVGLVTDWLDNTATNMYENTRSKSKKFYSQRYKEYKKLKCHDDDDDDDDDGKNEEDSNNPDNDPSIDPSGYVYEAVESNRLEGVKATCYYKETVEDMYGDLHENVVLWDAEEYAQKNPLFTDENGMYRWDVPQGLWQVKFEKDGYETTHSEWLPVPPPQLEVNIAMTQLVQPRVLTTNAYENAIDIEFDKYMDAATLTTERVKALQDNTAATAHVVLQDAEKVGEQTLVKHIRLELDDANASFALDKPVTVTVSRRVESYAGKQMLEDFVQEFDVKKELTRIVCDSAMTVAYGDTVSLVVTVMPVEVSAGQTLKVSSSSAMILSTVESEAVIDEDGKAYITVVGELPGTSVLNYSVADSRLTASTIVNIVDKSTITVAAPTASIASGTEVEKGTQVTLSTATEGATIYYTTDGSCPCNPATAQVYDGTPITINETVTIKAMAAKEGMYESDVAEFNYTVSGTTTVKDLSLNGDLKIAPLPMRDKLNITAGGRIINSVSIVSANGVTVLTANVSAQEAHLNVGNIPVGTYILNILTDGKVFSRKVMKVDE